MNERYDWIKGEVVSEELSSRKAENLRQRLAAEQPGEWFELARVDNGVFVVYKASQ